MTFRLLAYILFSAPSLVMAQSYFHLVGTGPEHSEFESLTVNAYLSHPISGLGNLQKLDSRHLKGLRVEFLYVSYSVRGQSAFGRQEVEIFGAGDFQRADGDVENLIVKVGQLRPRRSSSLVGPQMQINFSAVESNENFLLRSLILYSKSGVLQFISPPKAILPHYGTAEGNILDLLATMDMKPSWEVIDRSDIRAAIERFEFMHQQEWGAIKAAKSDSAASARMGRCLSLLSLAARLKRSF